MGAKEYLEQYSALNMETRHLEDRIEEAFYETQIPGMRDSDGSQKTQGRGDRQEKAYIRYIDTKDRLQPKIDANKKRMGQIEEITFLLSDPMQRAVLRLRYIDADSWKPVPWRLVALEMYKNDDEKDILRVKRLHREALVALGAIILQNNILDTV